MGREIGQKRGAQGKRADQRQRAIGADPAVLHDLQRALARGVAEEPVRRVGQTVLVQRAGQPDEKKKSDQGAGEGLEPERGEAEKDQGRRQRHGQTDEREGEGIAPQRMRAALEGAGARGEARQKGARAKEAMGGALHG